MKSVAIRGERVTLREVRPSDIPFLRIWWAEPDGNYYDVGHRDPLPEKALQKIEEDIMNNQLPHWFIIDSERGEPVGYLLYRNHKEKERSMEIAIRLGQAHWGKGYGTDATRVFVEYIFKQFQLVKVWLCVLDFNLRAIRSYEKCGFKVKLLITPPGDNRQWYLMEIYRGQAIKLKKIAGISPKTLPASEVRGRKWEVGEGS